MQPLHIVSLVNRYRPNDALNVRNIRISFGFNLSMYGVFKVTEMLVYVSPVRTFSQMIQDTWGKGVFPPRHCKRKNISYHDKVQLPGTTVIIILCSRLQVECGSRRSVQVHGWCREWPKQDNIVVRRIEGWSIWCSTLELQNEMFAGKDFIPDWSPSLQTTQLEVMPLKRF